jgi:hypothetical protein
MAQVVSEISYDPSLERSFRGHRAAVNSISFAPVRMLMLSPLACYAMLCCYVLHLCIRAHATHVMG